MPRNFRPSIHVLLGSVLASVGIQPITACGSSSCPSVPAGYRPPFSEWTVEVTNRELVESGATSGHLEGSACETLCSEGRYFYDNSCTLSFDPKALESSDAAANLRDKGQALDDGFGGAGGEGGDSGLAGSLGAPESSVGGSFASTGGSFAPVGGASKGGSLGLGGRIGSSGGSGPTAPTVWPVQVSCSGVAEYPCEGRRHASWGPRETSTCRNALGAWFARAAQNEASSVHSFRALRSELRGTRPGERFATRLRKAARDEIRHARLMEREARRFGARRPGQEFTRLVDVRSLEDIAIENAREGCVFEMYAALEMCVLAERAASAEHRAMFASIAQDEAEHAELAWDLHAAFLEALRPPERGRVEAALKDALEALANAPSVTVQQEVHDFLGLPQNELAQALRTRLCAETSRLPLVT
jgi:hypothetical protein